MPERESVNRGTGSGYRPRGITLLYEDADIIVVDKPCGLLTMGTDRDKSRTAHSILNEYVRKGNPKSRNRVYIVHRLDRETSGVLLFAKSESAKFLLQSQWETAGKLYLAAVSGHPSPPRDTISSYLSENSALTVYSTQDPEKGKLSKTSYAVIKEQKGISLLNVHLLTGRKHQIRVHLAEKGHPVVGDRKYGKARENHAQLYLHAYSITFTHPVNGIRLEFQTAVPERFARMFGVFELPAGFEKHHS